MSVRARILAIRITELVNKNPEAATTLGVSATLVTRKDRSTNDEKATNPIVVTRTM